MTMSMHQPEPHEKPLQQSGSGSAGLQKLTLRTDSVTLSPPPPSSSSQHRALLYENHSASGTSSSPFSSLPSSSSPAAAAAAPAATVGHAGGAHQKHPSASSMSSASSASTSSKTAAFFSANHEAGIRPARSSSTSMHTSASVSKPSSPQQLQRSSNIAPLSHGNVARMAADSHSLTAAQTAGLSHSVWDGMELDRSSSQSSSQHAGRRSWRDFEGRSITPLPSPGGVADERQDHSGGVDAVVDGYRFPVTHSLTLSHQAAAAHPSSPPVSSSASSQPISATLRLTPSWSGADLVDSPKTSNFFGSSSRSSQSLKLVSSKEPRAGLPHERQHDFRPRFPSSSTDTYESIYAPSRFPSVNAHHPTPGVSSQPSATAENGHQGATQHFQNFTIPRSSSPARSSTLIDSDFATIRSGTTQMTPRLVPGTHPIVPSAFVSPPSPDPDSAGGASTDNTPRPDQVSSTDSSTTWSSSSSKRSNGSSRHTYGPSENATSSSIVPPFASMRSSTQDQATSAYYPEPPPQQTRLQDDGHDPHRIVSSSQGTPKIEESEDEASGTVGAYTVDRILGVGAFSRVVLARRSKSAPNDGLVALKMLEQEPCRQNERMRVSWVREVEVLKHIVHPNIVRFITSFSTNKHHVLVLETVEGGELFDFLANEQSEIIQREWLVRSLFGQLANAVGWMHNINLVHRDIKLENIILTKHFRAAYPLSPARMPNDATPLIKLSDFGLSRFIDPQAPHLETRCGSEEYAAPELIIGKRYDGRQTDVWAMGVVLYALLSGSLPFLSASGETDASSRAAHSRDDVQSDGTAYLDARARKAHLLRIAKGDLRWPSQTNDACQDAPDAAICPTQHRLITPPARMLVARLLRRDAAKRAAAWEVWDESWMQTGSFQGCEASMLGQTFTPPHDPRSPLGLAWLQTHACVQAGAPDVVHDD